MVCATLERRGSTRCSPTLLYSTLGGVPTSRRLFGTVRRQAVGRLKIVTQQPRHAPRATAAAYAERVGTWTGDARTWNDAGCSHLTQHAAHPKTLHSRASVSQSNPISLKIGGRGETWGRGV
eukprot:2228810-Prymnesium_polylepis.1